MSECLYVNPSKVGVLAGSSKQNEALWQVLALMNAERWRIREQVARALKRFDDPQAKAALSVLMNDKDHSVFSYSLEKAKKKESHLGDSPDHQGASTSHKYKAWG